MKIAIIGVGTAGVKAADKINFPDCSKLFIDSEVEPLENVKSEGEAILLDCKDRDDCPLLYCYCYMCPQFCKKVAESYEDEIRHAIISAFSK